MKGAARSERELTHHFYCTSCWRILRHAGRARRRMEDLRARLNLAAEPGGWKPEPPSKEDHKANLVALVLWESGEEPDAQADPRVLEYFRTYQDYGDVIREVIDEGGGPDPEEVTLMFHAAYDELVEEGVIEDIDEVEG